MLGRKKAIFFFKSAKLFRPFLICSLLVSKITQGSCLGCLGGYDAPELILFNLLVANNGEQLRSR